jgi:hypothetical protein
MGKGDSRHYDCSGSVKVYDYYLFYKNGNFVIKDKEMNTIYNVYTTHNAVDKLVSLVINSGEDFSVAHYMEVRQNVKKLVEGIDSE